MVSNNRTVENNNLWKDFYSLNEEVSLALKRYELIGKMNKVGLEALGIHFQVIAEKAIKLHQSFKKQKILSPEDLLELETLSQDLTNLGEYYEQAIESVKEFVNKHRLVKPLVDNIERVLRAEIEDEEKECKERFEQNGKKSTQKKKNYITKIGPALLPVDDNPEKCRLKKHTEPDLKATRTKALDGWPKEYSDGSDKEFRVRFKEPTSLIANITHVEVMDEYVDTIEIVKIILDDKLFMGAYHLLMVKFQKELEIDPFFEVRRP